MFVIKKGDLYVAKRGSKSSYTKKLQEAEKYFTIEEASRNICPENERIVRMEEE